MILQIFVPLSTTCLVGRRIAGFSYIVKLESIETLGGLFSQNPTTSILSDQVQLRKSL